MTRSKPLVFALVFFCFFISGVAGLAYQIVWTRYLALFLGHTSYSIVAVLVAFMGGLALGNAWLGAWADRSRRPLALYAVLEIAIGLYALAFPSYYALCHDWFIDLAKSWQPEGGLLLALKFVVSLLAILLPTVLMGATFPVLTKFATQSMAELRGRVAALYALNSAGAVAGCFVADFWWIPSIGLEMTVWLGAALNLGVGVVALLLSWAINERQSSLERVAPASPQEASVERFTEREWKLSLAAIGLSGFVAMLYEVAWTRVLALVLGSSTHAFSIMLITFISGITAGSWIVYRSKRMRNTVVAFAWAEIALAVTVFISMLFYDALPYGFVRLANLLARREEAYPLYETLQMLICFAVMFVPTVLLGMTVPLASRIGTLEISRAGSSVGRVLAVNTLGTVLGTAMTGLWLLPALGLARTFALGVGLNAAIGWALLAEQRTASRRRHMIAVPVGIILFVWVAGLIFDQKWQRSLSLGAWRLAEAPDSLTAYRRLVASQELKYYKDGASSTVSVFAPAELGPGHLTLKINGKPEASTSGDVPTQLLSGHIPMFLKPAAAQVLVVGLGSGMTCSAVARHPSLERLDIVEISPEVVAAARWFGPYNDNILDDSRVRVAIDDAKSFLQITERAYDIIISEPSNPWMAGVAGVFTREFYATCARRLAAGGLMVQWIHLNETNDRALETVLATFASVFPHINIWQGAVKDLLLIGSLQPIQADLDQILQRFNHAPVRSDLARFGVSSVAAFLACEIVSSGNGAFLFSPDALVHSDFYPVLEYIAQKSLFVRSRAEHWRNFDERQSARPTTLLAKYLAERGLVEADWHSFVNSYLSHRLFSAELLRSLLRRCLRDRPEADLPLQMTVLLDSPAEPAEAQALRLSELRDRIEQRAAKDPELLRSYAGYLMQRYRLERSVFFVPAADELQRLFQLLVEVDPNRRAIYETCLAELAWDRGDDAACLSLGQRVFELSAAGQPTAEIEPAAPALVLARMIESLWRANQFAEAVALCQRAQSTGGPALQNGEGAAVLQHVCRKVAASARF